MNEITTPQTSSTKTALLYGVMFGVIIILETVVSYVMRIGADNAYGTVISILNYLILPFLFIFLGCNAIKNNDGGFISFGQCLKTGVLICVIAALISGIAGAILNAMFPDYMLEVMEQAREQMLSANPDMTEEQLEMGMSAMEMFQKPWIAVPVATLIFAFVGLIHSLIIGAIVKKDKPTF